MEVKEFNILGHSIRLKEVEDDAAVTPDEIVSYVNNEAIKMKQGNPNLKDSQIAVLLALKYATDKVTLEREYKESITEFERMAEDAFKLIEEVTPSTH